MKKNKFFKAYLYKALFIAMTVVLAMLVCKYPDFMGAMLFAELLVAQIFTRYMVMLQMKNFELRKALYPQAAFFSIGGIVTQVIVNFVSCMSGEFFHQFGEKYVVFHVFMAMMFTLIYLFFTRRDRRKSKNLAHMSEFEIKSELYKIHRAQYDIKCAEHILEQSPLY